jgi:thioredoxin-like negative regulator of GroEL
MKKENQNLLTKSQKRLIIGKQKRKMKKVNKKYFKRFFEGDAKPHIIKLFSNNCHVCVDLKPDFAKLSSELSKDYESVLVDVDEEPELSNLLAEDGVPTIYLFKNGSLKEIKYPDDGYNYSYLKESILKEINLED